LNEWFSGLRAQYGDPNAMPAEVQRPIDYVLEPLAAFVIEDPTLPSASRMARDVGDMTDALRSKEQVAQQTAASTQGGLATPPSLTGALKAHDVAFAGFTDLSLDDYARTMTRSEQDLSKLYAAIQYLRQLEGEKHVVYTTPFGMVLPRLEDSQSLAAYANDSRVAIDTIQTGGTSGSWSVYDTEHLAIDTGGVSSIYSAAIKGTTRIADANSFGYVLGYYPADTNLDGRFRRIQVKVNRSRVEVLYRHGYYARQPSAPLDASQLLSYNRVVAALNTTRPQTDLGLTMTAKYQPGTKTAARHVVVHITLDARGLSLTQSENSRTGTIDVAVFCGDSSQPIVGSTWHSVDLRMTDDAYARLAAHGLTIDEDIPVSKPANHVKVIVYDKSADRVGSATVTIH
jgi:hypothetical protein